MEYTFSGVYEIKSDGKCRYALPERWLKNFCQKFWIYPYHKGNYIISSADKLNGYLDLLSSAEDGEVQSFFATVKSKIFQVEVDSQGRIFLPDFKGLVIFSGKGDYIEILPNKNSGDESNYETCA